MEKTLSNNRNNSKEIESKISDPIADSDLTAITSLILMAFPSL